MNSGPVSQSSDRLLSFSLSIKRQQFAAYVSAGIFGVQLTYLVQPTLGRSPGFFEHS